MASTSKPAKLLISLWIRFSWKEKHEVGNNRTAGKSQRSEPWHIDEGQRTLQGHWAQRETRSNWLKQIHFYQKTQMSFRMLKGSKLAWGSRTCWVMLRAKGRHEPYRTGGSTSFERTCYLWAKQKQLSEPRTRGLIAGWGLHVTTFFSEQWGGVKAQASLDKILVALPFSSKWPWALRLSSSPWLLLAGYPALLRGGKEENICCLVTSNLTCPSVV